jgi:hypothetical protein
MQQYSWAKFEDVEISTTKGKLITCRQIYDWNT